MKLNLPVFGSASQRIALGLLLAIATIGSYFGYSYLSKVVDMAPNVSDMGPKPSKEPNKKNSTGLSNQVSVQSGSRSNGQPKVVPNPADELLAIARKREAHRKFLAQHSYSNRPFYNKEDWRAAGLPRQDRPDWAFEQDYLRTIDPATGTVPYERRFPANKVAKDFFGGFNRASDATWNERGPNNIGGRTRALMFDPNDATNRKAWAGGVSGGLWFNNDVTNAASTWTKVNDLWENIAITTIAFSPANPQTFYVGTGEGFFNVDAVRGGGIWKTTNAGATWSLLPSTVPSGSLLDFDYVNKIVVNSAGHVFAGTRSRFSNRGGVMKSTDGGTTWTKVLAPRLGVGVAANTQTADRIMDIELAANGDIYVASGHFNPGMIFRSSDGGATWTNVSPVGLTGQGRIELAIAPSTGTTTANTTLYAVAHLSAATNSRDVAWFVRSDDGGDNWTPVEIPLYVEQNCNQASNHFTRGQAWYDLILAVHPTNPDLALAGGIDIHRSTDGGVNWQPVSYWTGNCLPYVHADIHALVFRPGNPNQVAVGSDGGINFSTNVGDVGQASPTFSTNNVNYNVTQYYSGALRNATNDNYMLGGTQDNGSLRLNSAATGAATTATGGDGGFCFIKQSDPAIQITSFTNNNYNISTNGGTSFSALLRANDGSFINPADFDDANDLLYSAASTTAIRRTGITPGSSELVEVTGLSTTVDHLRVSPYSPPSTTTLFLGTSDGRILKVANAQVGNPIVPVDITSNISTVGSVSCIELGASENEILVTYSNYGVLSVWYTSNGGTSWTSKDELAHGLPDIPVRWALFNPLNYQEVLLATEVGVWASNNITAANPGWVPVNSTLANTRVDMLQVRNSDYLVQAATHGRGMFTSTVFAPTTPTWVGNAWIPAAPTAATNAIIASSTPSSPPSFICNNLTVNSGVTLTVGSGVTATVNGVLNYIGNITVQSGGSLVQTSGSTVGTSTGTFTAQRTYNNGANLAYNFWSSPVAGVNVSTLGGNASVRFVYNENNNTWTAAAGTMTIGQGYTAITNNSQTTSFIGTPNNGNVVRSALTRTAANTAFLGFHLVGNPYPSPITIAGSGTSFLLDAAQNPSFEAQAWVFEDNKAGTGVGQYRTVNALLNGNQIAVGQGFFVRTTVNNNTLTFRNNHRAGGNPTFFRGEEPRFERLDLQVRRSDGMSDIAYVAFGDGFTSSHDPAFDGYKMEAGSPVSLAVTWSGAKYEVAALPNSAKERLELPLSLTIGQAGEHVFSVEPQSLNPDKVFFLEDRQTSEFYYLLPGRKHKLNLQAGNYRDRFFLRSTTEVAGLSGETVGAYSFGRELFVEVSETAQVVIYNTMGIQIQHFAGVEAGSLRRLAVDVPSSGIYVVRVATENSTVEKRVWLEK